MRPSAGQSTALESRLSNGDRPEADQPTDKRRSKPEAASSLRGHPLRETPRLHTRIERPRGKPCIAHQMAQRQQQKCSIRNSKRPREAVGCALSVAAATPPTPTRPPRLRTQRPSDLSCTPESSLLKLTPCNREPQSPHFTPAARLVRYVIVTLPPAQGRSRRGSDKMGTRWGAERFWGEEGGPVGWKRKGRGGQEACARSKGRRGRASSAPRATHLVSSAS